METLVTVNLTHTLKVLPWSLCDSNQVHLIWWLALNHADFTALSAVLGIDVCFSKPLQSSWLLSGEDKAPWLLQLLCLV